MYKWVWISAVVLIVDQVSKWLITANLQLQEISEIVPSLKFRLLHNEGAAFSLFSEAGGWQRWFFTAIAITVSGAIVVWIYRLQQHERWKAVSLTLILGGALGNVIDRIRLGYVVDFIEVYYGQWSWPAFNVADSAISVGAVMLVIEAIREIYLNKAKQSDAP